MNIVGNNQSAVDSSKHNYYEMPPDHPQLIKRDSDREAGDLGCRWDTVGTLFQSLYSDHLLDFQGSRARANACENKHI